MTARGGDAGRRPRTRAGRRGAGPALAVGLALLSGACASPVEPPPRPVGDLPVPRSVADRPDAADGHQIHVIYAVPRDGPDGALDTAVVIAASVARMDDWFHGLSGGRRLRLDRAADGRPDVSFVALPAGEAELEAFGPYLRDEIERHVNDAGFSHPRKLYLVYYDGRSSHACGGAAFGPDLPGNVVALYLRGRPAGARRCDRDALLRGAGVGYWEQAALHDLLHALGFVAACAPNHRGAGHVGDSPHDLMHAGPAPWRPLRLDVGNDDYFGHGDPGCPDLARSAFLDPPAPATEPPPGWNMGHGDSAACR